MSAVLADFIRPVPRYARATNLERDLGLDSVSDYHLVEPGLDVIRRLVRDRGTSAIVITGPYGSGKSTFAVYLDALLGPKSDLASANARARLRAVDAALGAALERYLDRIDPRGRGFVRAIATGRPESVAVTALRALATGVQRHPSVPGRLRRHILDAHTSGLSAAEVAALYRDVGRHAPVGLILDELGVVLDAALDPIEDGLWLLQDLAESLSGPSSAGFVVGLQHRSLVEQIAGERGLPAGWRKVQGRFEEVPFVESRDTLLSLIGSVFHRTSDTWLDGAVGRWSAACSASASKLGLDNYIPGDAGEIAAGYPLHPSVLLVLPDLTSAYGQRERTLLAFLAGNEPESVGQFLEAQPAIEPLPVVDLPRVYDFFVGSGNHRLGPPGHISRWAEVERRIREAGVLDPHHARVVRAIALLNLVGRGGPARASSAVLEFAVPGAPDALESLLARGLITYRASSDEYRIWEGSDLDLDAAIAGMVSALERQPIAELLSTLIPLAPIVAAAHSERFGILRSFDRRYAGAAPRAPVSRDGLILYAVGHASTPETPTSDRPIILLKGTDLDRLRSLAVEAAALGRLLADDQLQGDWVARREIGERYGLAVDRLHGQLEKSFAPSSAHPTLILDGTATELEPDLLSRLASAASDRAYPAAPQVHNEMFAINELTSQGARARSLLFAAMIQHAEEPELSLEGWGPERAMYASVLAGSELHDPAARPPYGPTADSPYRAVWEALRATMYSATDTSVTVEDVLASVESRPYGLRRSLSPVIWLAVMLAEREQLALFERGSFVPQLTAELMDRLVKAPEAFSVRHVAALGARAEFVEVLHARLSPGGESAPTVTSVVSRLVLALRRLAPYSLRTYTVSPEAQRVRAAVMTAREPDRLLFEAIPLALGVESIEADGSAPADLAAQVSAVLIELAGAFRALHGRVGSRIAEAFGLADGETLRSDLRALCHPLLPHIAERRLRGVLMAAIDPSLPDSEWLDALVVACGMPPLSHWDDDAERAFEATVRELGRTQRRLVVLYAEAWAKELTDGFVARRVTITRSDGHETSDVVVIDANDALQVRHIVDDLVRKAEDLWGPAGSRMVMAALAERLEESEEQDAEVAADRPA